MKICISLFIVFALACNAYGINTGQSDNSFLLKNVNIVDVAGQAILPGKAILVEGGKITAINDNESALSFKDIEVIDGYGGYVTPGLIDMHVHMYEEAAYILTLNHGVTHVRILNGVPKQLLWRDNIAAGIQLGSSSTVSSPIISGNKDAYLQRGVETAEEARNAVREYHAQGYDLIKAYGSLNQISLTAIVDETKKLNMPLAKHGPHASGDMPISSLTDIQSFEHVEDIYQGSLNHQFSPELLPDIMFAIKSTDVPVTPTLNIFYQLTKLSQEKHAYLAQGSAEYTSDIIAFETSQNQVKRWLGASDAMAIHNQKTFDFLLYITKQLHQSGINLLVGSDSGVLLSPHGIATHNEMDLLKKAGLSPYEVLAAATINPAKALNLESQLGKIAKNYKADFIYSSTNPVADLSILKESEAVIKNGYWYSRDKLDDMKNAAIESRSVWSEFLVLFEAL